MKLYIYEIADCPVSNEYHPDGGVVICTAGEPQDAWAKDCGENKAANGKLLRDGNLGEPDRVVDMPPSTEEFVIVFPDQGCC